MQSTVSSPFCRSASSDKAHAEADPPFPALTDHWPENLWRTSGCAAYGRQMSSVLRDALRSRLTVAIRERDRGAAAVLRSAVAALENAEAVSVADQPVATGSSDVAGAALGVGATEVQRRVLGATEERAVVEAEVQSLADAEQAYAALGDVARASAAAAGIAVLREVLDDTAAQRS